MIDYLMPPPSMLTGIVRIVDLGATFNSSLHGVVNASSVFGMIDGAALRNDWNMVGNDIRGSIIQYGQSWKEERSRSY